MIIFDSIFEKFFLLSERENVYLLIQFSFVLLIVLFSPVFMKYIAVRPLKLLITKTQPEFADNLIANKAFRALTFIGPPIFISIGLTNVPLFGDFISRLVGAWLAIGFAIIIGRVIAAITATWRRHTLFVKYPIRSYMQLARLVVYILAFVVAICSLLDRSPIGILSGIGAIGAILILVFRDTILGLVASVQVYGSGRVLEGDWIEIEKLGIDGMVTDVGLHMVKVQAWDNTMVTFPTANLLEYTFKNWRGMSDSGGRRIKRSLIIDQSTVKFLDDSIRKKLSNITILKSYFKEKDKNLLEANKSLSSGYYNRRSLTNLGTFRAYVNEYLKKHEMIRNDMTLMVRYGDPSPEGLPIEIYAFTATTDWQMYEDIQSDIFDHLIAILSEFDLGLFQVPDGNSLQALSLSLSSEK